MEPIKADYIGMLSEADRLWRLISLLTTQINNLKGVMNDIDIFWDGEANDEFHLALNKDFVVMDVLCLKIKLSANLIKGAVSEYTMAEKAVEELIGGLR